MMQETQDFYDGFADDYQFLFADWQSSVARQAGIISEFFGSLGESHPKTVLDCTCGIGTQAIGLATQGYQVHGTDLSPKAIGQAKSNAAQFNLDYPIQFEVVNLLQAPSNPDLYDITMAFDNPIAHFQTETELKTAFRTMASHTKTGGLVTTSLRDYDALVQEQPKQSHLTVRDEDTGRRIMFQVWDWYDDNSGYSSEMFVIVRDGKQWKTKSYTSQFRAWQRDDVSQVLTELGLSDIEWHMPEQSGYYQPIVTARK